MEQQPIPYKSAGIFPLFSQIEKLAERYPTMSFHFLLEKFADDCYKQNSIFILSSIDCAKVRIFLLMLILEIVNCHSVY